MSSEAEAVVRAATEGGSDSENEFVDAEEDGADGDLTRPSDWTPSEKEADIPDSATPPALDSAGNPPSSPDYVDEAALEAEEANLIPEEREERRIQANQLKAEGNSLYKEGKTQEAVDKYTAGLRLCPVSCVKDRAVLYANRGQMKRVLGLNDQAVRNCTRAVELDPAYLKALLRRAEIYEETDKLDESLADYTKVLELDPKHVEANRAVRRLPPKIEERNEKLKAEMMDSLKKLGNMVLKPFGLSTDNFKMEQDPNSGGYNIQFSQNK